MCRLPTHHIAMHLPRSYHPYIFPTTPTTIRTTPPYFLQHTQPSTIFNHVTSPPPSNHTLILTSLSSIITSQNTTPNHTTMNPNLHRNTILPSKCTSLHKSHIHRHKQAEQFLTIPHCYQHAQQT